MIQRVSVTNGGLISYKDKRNEKKIFEHTAQIKLIDLHEARRQRSINNWSNGSEERFQFKRTDESVTLPGAAAGTKFNLLEEIDREVLSNKNYPSIRWGETEEDENDFGPTIVPSSAIKSSNGKGGKSNNMFMNTQKITVPPVEEKGKYIKINLAPHAAARDRILSQSSDKKPLVYLQY